MGSGSGHTAQATRPAKRRFLWDLCCRGFCDGGSPNRSASMLSVLRPLPIRCGSADPVGSVLLRRWITRDDQVCRAISTGQLSALPRLHSRPIDVVVFHGPQGSPRFEVGFPLRCLQRLSRPRLATRRCGWRHNRCTRGASVPVLSYWGRRLASLLRPRQIGTELSHDVLNPAHVPL